MNNVNKPCFCGSGKKYKKCHLNSKPRIKTITYDFGKEVTIDSISLNTITGKAKFSFESQNIPFETANLGVHFEKSHKEKLLNQIRISKDFTLNHYEALLKFDLLLAIDTNTISLNQHKLSVSCLIGAEIHKTDAQSINKYLEKKTLELKVFDSQLLAMWNVEEKQENLGWMMFIQLVMQNPIYKTKSKIGVIVDSDFGNIESYNSRKLPIYENFHLPENIELIYATRDSGAEFWANKLIRLADAEANEAINAAKNLAASGKSDEFLGSHQVDDKPYTHFSFWVKRYDNKK